MFHHHALKLVPLLILFMLLAASARADILYGSGVDLNTQTYGLYLVDTSNGTATLIGPTGVFLTDIALSPGNVLYGITDLGAGGQFTSSLVKVDQSTGAASLVGPLGSLCPADACDFANGLTFSGATLFASTINTGAGGQLLTVDPDTGAVTQSRAIGDFSSSGDLAVCGGQLFMTAFGENSAPDQLISVDTVTGAGTLVGSIGFFHVFGLACGQSGALFGLTDSGQVISINMATGAGSLIATNGIAWQGAATGPPPQTVFLLVWPVHPDRRADLTQAYGQFDDGRANYFHTGIDIRGATAVDVVATAAGDVVKIQKNHVGCVGYCADHGFGNTVVIEHSLSDGRVLYSQYSHLESIDSVLEVACGTPDPSTQRIICSPPVHVDSQRHLGQMGRTGFGQPDRWPRHLHFELKDFDTLTPFGDDPPFDDGFGYTEEFPDDVGYQDPILSLHAVNELNPPLRVRITTSDVRLRVGPGGSGGSEQGDVYREIRLLDATLEYKAFLRSNPTTNPVCGQGWFQVRNTDDTVLFTDVVEGGMIRDGWVCADFTSIVPPT